MATIKELLESEKIKDVKDLFRSGNKPTINDLNNLLEYALSESTCLKHPVAAVIYDMCGDYVELGWNGPPDFMEHDKCLREGYPSGKGMELCPGSHAETRAISKVAEYNESTHNGTIYLSSWFPCVRCADSIKGAGIKRVVTPDEIYEDAEKKTLVKGLRNQPYNFEMAERVLRKANIEIIVDKSIKPAYKKNE